MYVCYALRVRTVPGTGDVHAFNILYIRWSVYRVHMCTYVGKASAE